MKSTTKNMTFITAAIALILISLFFITKTVQGQTDTDVAAKESYFRVLEQEYVCDIREYLDDQGFLNSGVSLTRVVDEQGNRDYQITLHHKYLSELSKEEQEIIFDTIKDMAFSENGCIFRVNLLV